MLTKKWIVNILRKGDFLNIKAILISGIVAGIVIFLTGNLFYYAFQDVFMQPTGIQYKEMPMPEWLFELLAVNLVIGIVFAGLYAIFEKVIDKPLWIKGLIFGLSIGIFLSVVTTLTNYILYVIPMSMLVLSFFENIFSLGISGIVLSIVYNKFRWR